MTPRSGVAACKTLCFVSVFIFFTLLVSAQLPGLPSGYIEKLTCEYNRSTQNIRKSTSNLLKRLSKLDAMSASKFGAAQKIGTAPKDTVSVAILDYNSTLDSAAVGISFLSRSPELINSGTSEELTKLSSKYIELQTELNQAAQLKQYMRQRATELKSALTPKEIRKLKEQLYYYDQQVKQYKELLNSPEKIQARLLEVLRQMPAFRSFFLKNSYLSSLYPQSSGAIASPAALEGLQSRSNVLLQVNTVLGNTGPASANFNPLQGLGGEASAEVDKVRKDIARLGSSGDNLDMPADFKFNGMKKRSFLKRIEYGMNIQSQPHTGTLPSIFEIALTAGYKINDDNTIGLGASYKQGLGSFPKKISLSAEGLSLRSFVNYKLYNSFYLAGGLEMNYLSSINSNDLRRFENWQSSGLIGLSKKYTLGKAKNYMQLLWDFLSYSQQPRSRAIIFRVGYTL